MRIAFAAALWLLAAAAGAGEIEFSGEIGGKVDLYRETYRSGDLFEYLTDPDSYQEEYSSSVIESDATRASGVLGLGLDRAGSRLSFSAENEYAYGPELLRDAFEAEISWRIAPRRLLRISERLDVRRDVDGSLSYEQDLQHAASAEFRADSLAGRWTVRLREDISSSRVEDDSLGRVFDYDRNRVSLSLERRMRRGEWGLEGWIVHKEAPAGVNGAYREPGLKAFLRRRSDEAWYWEAEAESRRRGYFDASLAGAGSWSHEVRAIAGLDRATGWGLEFTDEMTLSRYDEPDEVYMDYLQNRSEVRGRLDLSERISTELAPAFEILEADAGQRYGELSAEAGVSLDIANEGWLHLSQEVGRRDYSGGADSTLSISFGSLDVSLQSSDYLFTTSSLMGRMGIGGGLAFEVYFDYTLEKHEGGDGDFSLLSCTASLSRRF